MINFYDSFDRSWAKVRHVDCKGGSNSSSETDQSTRITTTTTTNLNDVSFGPTQAQIDSVNEIATNAQNNATAQVDSFNKNIALPSLTLNAQNFNSLVQGGSSLVDRAGSVSEKIINDSSNRAGDLINLASKVTTGTELTQAKLLEVMGTAIPIIGALFAISLAVRKA